MTKALVCGGRAFRDRTLLFGALDGIHRARPFSRVIHGAADGADTLAGRWAEEQCIPVDEYPAEWQRFGRRAGYLRNARMLREGLPDLVVAFPGGPGTDMMKRLARDAGVEVIEIAAKP